MCSHMNNEFWELTEGLPTFFAFIRLFSSVNSYVYYEVGRTKGLPAFFMFVWLISTVTSSMFCEVWGTTESFPTAFTFNVALYTVDLHMFLKNDEQLNVLAYCIHKVSLLWGLSCPSFKKSNKIEGFPTFLTLGAFESSIRSNVIP